MTYPSNLCVRIQQTKNEISSIIPLVCFTFHGVFTHWIEYNRCA